MPNKRALIVDDSTTAQYRLKKMLRSYSLDIDFADSGEAALRYLATHAPDVIFMDHLMPGMDGFRVLQIIKSFPETAMIPVIMYTSKSGDVYTGQARALGALDVVSKDTITAAELSKVMLAIHVCRKGEEGGVNDKASPPIESPAKAEAPASKPVDISSYQIERRAPDKVMLDQARNLELRLSRMEHALEDSSRFITSRVVRELQGLKKNIKQEFSEIIEHQHAHTEVQPAQLESLVAPSTSGTSLFSKLVIVIALICIAFYLIKMSDALTQGQDQQQKFSEQLALIAAQKATNAQAPINTVATPVSLTETPKRPDNAYLAEVAWAFNQTALLPFNQSSIDTKTVIRLYELLNRLIAKDYKGSVWINIYVGNFCIVTNNNGQGQLADENLAMSNCMTSNEIYGLDRVMEQYQSAVESALRGLDDNPSKAIRIIINTLSETGNYPERKASLNAKAWNSVAQNHNRLELKLEPSTTELSAK